MYISFIFVINIKNKYVFITVAKLVFSSIVPQIKMFKLHSYPLNGSSHGNDQIKYFD